MEEVAVEQVVLWAQGADAGVDLPQHVISDQHQVGTPFIEANMPIVMARRLQHLEAIGAGGNLLPFRQPLDGHGRRGGEALLGERVPLP